MVQQTKDSIFTEYRLTCVESSLSNSDKLLSLSVSTKKTGLKDSYNENTMMVSKSIGSPLLVEDSGRAGEVVESSRTKRPTPECLLSPPKTNAGSGHIVYVRRKPETELTKNNIFDNHSDAVDCPHLGKSSDQSETTLQHAEMNELVIWKSNVSSTHTDSSPSFSSTRHSVPPSVGISSNISSPGNIDQVHVDCANPSSIDPIKVNLEERYFRLQNLLKMLDQSDQDDYIQMLRSLSSVELSRHAVELEKRSIKLSLEEAKEMQRFCCYDVLGKYPKNLSRQSTE